MSTPGAPTVTLCSSSASTHVSFSSTYGAPGAPSLELPPTQRPHLGPRGRPLQAPARDPGAFPAEPARGIPRCGTPRGAKGGTLLATEWPLPEQWNPI